MSTLRAVIAPPLSGKTTAARLYPEIFLDADALETDRAGLKALRDAERWVEHDVRYRAQITRSLEIRRRVGSLTQRYLLLHSGDMAEALDLEVAAIVLTPPEVFAQRFHASEREGIAGARRAELARWRRTELLDWHRRNGYRTPVYRHVTDIVLHPPTKGEARD